MTDFSEEEADYFNPTGGGTTTDPSQNGEQPLFGEDEVSGTEFANYDAIFNAPDFSTLVKGVRSRRAREYETRVKSVLKSGAIGALRRGNLPDAAAIFHHGPAFSAAAGDLADVSDQTRKMIDLLTAPENPYVMFLLAALPFAAQFFRNHEPAIQQVRVGRKQMKAYRKAHPDEFVKKPTDKKNVEIKLPFGRVIHLRVGFKFNPLRGASFMFRARTRQPEELVTLVFTDQKLVAALKKQGIDIVQVPM